MGLDRRKGEGEEVCQLEKERNKKKDFQGITVLHMKAIT